MKTIHCLKILILLLLSLNLQAQEEQKKQKRKEKKAETKTGLFSQYEDVVYLKDNSIIKGVIVEKTPEFVKIEVLGGSHFVFQMEEIQEVKIEKRTFDPSLAKELRPYLFKNEGWYNRFSVGFLPGIAGNNQPRVGFTTHYSIGYLVKERIGVGAGFGLDVYSLFNDAEVITPFYLEARGYLENKPSTPYLSMAAGYGSVIPRWNVTESKGGLYLHPAFGMRIKTRKTNNFFLEAGIKIQYAAYTIQSWDESTEIRKTWFRRSALKIGMLF